MQVFQIYGRQHQKEGVPKGYRLSFYYMLQSTYYLSNIQRKRSSYNIPFSDISVQRLEFFYIFNFTYFISIFYSSCFPNSLILLLLYYLQYNIVFFSQVSTIVPMYPLFRLNYLYTFLRPSQFRLRAEFGYQRRAFHGFSKGVNNFNNYRINLVLQQNQGHFQKVLEYVIEDFLIYLFKETPSQLLFLFYLISKHYFYQEVVGAFIKLLIDPYLDQVVYYI